WKLAEAVRRHAEAAKAAAFRERLRTIRGLTRVEPVLGPNDRRQAPGLDLRYRVRWADDGLLVIETEWRVGEKWIGGGLAERYEIRSLANAARWRFRAAQPTLF
ncbi:MAG TPA: hypothetical protein VMY35_14465, partial [Phycisphaerae bacterium]|nr:hypothetical protein [Phycisphaerae bacterium]